MSLSVESFFFISPAPPKGAFPILVIWLAEPLFSPLMRVSKSASKDRGPVFFMLTLDTFSTLEAVRFPT
jgi:hypothetical protein